MGRPLTLMVLVVALAAGCGSGANEAGDGSSVRAVDRPASDIYERWSQPTYEITVSSGWACLEPEGQEDAPADDDCVEAGGKTWHTCELGDEQEQTDAECQEQLEESRNMVERWRRDIAPAPDSEPRVFAELDLAGGRRAELIGWLTNENRPCLLVRTIPGLPAWNVQLIGECQAYQRCSVLCFGALVLDEEHIALAGTLPDTAEAVRVTTERGRVILHELESPEIPGSDRRPFVIEMGSEEVWSKLEVFEGARVIETVDLSDPEGPMWECTEEEPETDECAEGESETAE